jgi:cyclophilin family peptidyl-prolyl cis-trans isomerase
MLKRIGVAAAFLLATHCGSATAQTARNVRFTTNVGTFDMLLNPTNDPDLQPLVDNLVAYIGLGRYHFTAVNRAVESGPGAADDFVLQMGGFNGFLPTPELWPSLHTPVSPLSPVVVDADNNGQVDFTAQSNVRGTVSLALQQGRPNSGTSSFFINLGDNSSILDSQGFVPFARIQNMSTITEIMRLMQTDLSQEVGQDGNPAFSDVPLTADRRLVVVTDVDVIGADEGFSFVGPIATALQLAARGSNSATSSSLADGSSSSMLSQESLLAENSLPPVSGGEIAPPAVGVTAVPEPATVALSLLGIFATFMAGRRRNMR